jgi:hypothetical protein
MTSCDCNVGSYTTHPTGSGRQAPVKDVHLPNPIAVLIKFSLGPTQTLSRIKLGVSIKILRSEIKKTTLNIIAIAK